METILRRVIWSILITSMFWSNAQATIEGTSLTIIHDKESGDEKDDGTDEEEEPDCD